MPLYEYRCEKCSKVSEILQGVGEKPARICPHCGGKLKKLVSTPAIQFKGSGWYVTDYAGKGKAPSEPSSSEKASESKKEKKEEKGAAKGSASHRKE
jgi:putative FmdB family regulatory protein